MAGPSTSPVIDEERAARVEEQVRLLVADGADEAAVQRLVREASRLRQPGP